MTPRMCTGALCSPVEKEYGMRLRMKNVALRDFEVGAQKCRSRVMCCPVLERPLFRKGKVRWHIVCPEVLLRRSQEWD